MAVAAAAWLSVVVARETHFTTGHRAAAAWTALLVVAALAIVAQVILLWYQARLLSATGDAPNQPTLAFRRRGLKAAVIGQDGRASTSKTQVALWTGAVVWALVDLLLLARAYSGGSLFINAVKTNWHPEYLALLGLPVAAATTAKAVVAGANAGQGPATSDPSSKAKIASGLSGNRVYVRDPISPGVWGFMKGVAELLTGDDDAVAWADLQYVVFTLITLVYFASQFLAQPAAGLPQMPAALLTLMGVSATGYTANKIVSTKVNTQDAPADGEPEVTAENDAGDDQLGGERAAVDLPGEHGFQRGIGSGQADNDTARPGGQPGWRGPQRGVGSPVGCVDGRGAGDPQRGRRDPRPGGRAQQRPQRAGKRPGRQLPGEDEQPEREGQPRGAEQRGQHGAGRERRPDVHAEQPAQGRVVGVTPRGAGALRARRDRPGQQHRRHDPAARVTGRGRADQRRGQCADRQRGQHRGAASQPPPVGPGQREGR